MPQETSTPRALIDGVIIGLVLMAVFTTAWSANTLATWPGTTGTTITAVGVLASACFLITAVRLSRTRAHASTTMTAQEQRWKKRSGQAFGWVFAAEGVLIAVAVNALGALGRPDLVLPAIALIVGVHFYPMAAIFQRRIDTYLATALSIVGAAGLVALLLTDASKNTVWGLVACGAALTTGTYGAYFTRMATQLLARSAATTPLPIQH